MNIGNTVARGDKFEDKVYRIILDILNRNEFGVLPQCCEVFRKKKYPSIQLNDQIEFDLSIEVTLPGASEYSLLYLIEAKDYSSRIPGRVINDFSANVRRVAGLNVKGIFVSTSPLQSRAVNIAKFDKIMWILVNGVQPEYKLYSSKKQRGKQSDTDLIQLQSELAHLQGLSGLIEAGKENEVDWDGLIEKLLRNAAEGNMPRLDEAGTEFVGLERLSGRLIEKIVNKVLDDFDANVRAHCLSLNTEQFITYLDQKHGVKVSYEVLPQESDRENRGAFLPESKTIIIDPSVVGTDYFKYILLHETGHFFLHRHIRFDQTAYNLMQDSKYNPETDRYDLINERNWIEWQANKFATSAIMPDLSVMARLITHQKTNGVRREGTMYVDNNGYNWQLFNTTISSLKSFFGVTQQVMEYRLGDLGILKFSKDFRRPMPIEDLDNLTTKTIDEVMSVVLRRMEIQSYTNKPAGLKEDEDPF